jgi:DNA-directed RNA polymerase alpha subunit
MYVNRIHLKRLHDSLREALRLVEDIRRIDSVKHEQLERGGGTVINPEELSSRAKRVIAIYDVHTVEDLAALTRYDLIFAGNAGDKTYYELRQLLHNHGLAFTER